MGFIEDSLERLTSAGYKVTNQRRSLLDVFNHEDDHYKSAKEVQDEVLQETSGVSLDTIYRNLKILTDLNIIEAQDINNETCYRKHCDPQMGHHHHFICTQCGKTIPIEECPLEEFQNLLPNCQINEHSFRLFGLCEDCLKEKND